MTLRTYPWARDALRAKGQWDEAVRVSALHRVRLSAKSAGGPFVATAGRLSTLEGTAVTDMDPLRAIERAIEAGGRR